MAKMTGLGKGLDALFGGAPLEVKNEEPEKIEQVESNENLENTLRLVKIVSVNEGICQGVLLEN